MPGPILTSMAMMNCPHLGGATALNADPRVTINGQPVLTIATQFSIAGCTFPAMSSGSPPCVMASFTTGATKVTSFGQFVLVGTSQGTSMPNGTPMLVAANPKNPIAQ